MKFYNKFYKSCYEELLTYYPDFYHNVYEMVEILKVFGRLSDDLESSIESIFDNCFLDTADKKTIETYEKIIGIAADEKKSLEERRDLVKSHLVGTGKISASLINEMIKALTGAETVCSFDNALTLKIDINRGEKSHINFSDIEKLLTVKIPAHIAFKPAIAYKKPIVISHELKTITADFPRCGLYFSGQKIMF